MTTNPISLFRLFFLSLFLFFVISKFTFYHRKNDLKSANARRAISDPLASALSVRQHWAAAALFRRSNRTKMPLSGNVKCAFISPTLLDAMKTTWSNSDKKKNDFVIYSFRYLFISLFNVFVLCANKDLTKLTARRNPCRGRIVGR